jgi:hypothetical protein
MRTLLSQCIYGGRIDNDFDQRLLNSFVNRLFTVKSFEGDFPLVSNIDGHRGKNINMPEGIRLVRLLGEMCLFQGGIWLVRLKGKVFLSRGCAFFLS